MPFTSSPDKPKVIHIISSSGSMFTRCVRTVKGDWSHHMYVNKKTNSFPKGWKFCPVCKGED